MAIAEKSSSESDRTTELRNVIDEGRRETSAARRTISFIVQLTITTCLFALAPLVPGAKHLFGTLTISQTFAYIAPGLLITYTNMILYRRLGPDDRRYMWAENLETFALYLAPFLFMYGAGKSSVPLWLPSFFTAIFWATTRPYDTRLYTGMIWTAQATLAIAFAARGLLHDAAIIVGVALAGNIALLTVARRSRKALLSQVERNLARHRLNTTRLNQQRDGIATNLWKRIGREIESIIDELATNRGASDRTATVIKQAKATLTELKNVVRPAQGESARTLRQLVGLIDEKCRALGAKVAIEAPAEPQGGSPVSGEAALAILRIAQELVRNAVSHGRAKSVQIAISGNDPLVLDVADDGSGLTTSAFEHSTGGLRNAKQWAGALGGTFELAPTGERPGARFRVSIPTQSAI